MKKSGPASEDSVMTENGKTIPGPFWKTYEHISGQILYV